MITTKRIYADYEKKDGFRVLVDRVWPRGIKKVDAHLDEWLKEIAPSTELRKWFGHKPENFPVFKEKYIAELQTEPAKSALAQLTTIVQRKEKVTLLYGAKDEVHNQAVVLAEYLNRKT
ncbi:DUF488 domain-containing protein [Enterococcus sp. MJM12]|uniref:DUF488 domain-containing protein n=1 Tax=Candidatus Enterococcus myersii TaxID=2815322 RepID=A0ABS3HAR2_9ENTE|nr:MULTISPECIES: DUF488 domain-containing protein [Enterococcus]MBO0450546.1 DUF488 domain-containing protein [Enterococcus sp. MJM12]MCD1023442.1 DUF488 domain-containing protein [Enterococcus sp. SMC-9]MDT2738670.1 DUF488 domain-containing protein [Enterococcus canintestini]WHA08261.1 DUF488 domain-containing protein [Enterococcus montenegrensis]